jgi:hypothetical protein
MHEFDQFFNGSSLYFFNLTFAHHVDNFVSCDCTLEQLDRLSEMGQLVYTNSTIQVIHRLWLWVSTLVCYVALVGSIRDGTGVNLRWGDFHNRKLYQSGRLPAADVKSLPQPHTSEYEQLEAMRW